MGVWTKNVGELKEYYAVYSYLRIVFSKSDECLKVNLKNIYNLGSLSIERFFVNSVNGKSLMFFSVEMNFKSETEVAKNACIFLIDHLGNIV